MATKPSIEYHEEEEEEEEEEGEEERIGKKKRKRKKKRKKGHITLIVGPMFAGKSTELQRRVRRARAAGKRVTCVRFMGDHRYGAREHICTHDRTLLEAIAVGKLADLEERVTEFSETDVFAVDEGQFFPNLSAWAWAMAECGFEVIIAALNSRFDAKSAYLVEPWHSVSPLLNGRADMVVHLRAICCVCRERPAPFSVMKSTLEVVGGEIEIEIEVDGEVETVHGDDIVVGGAELYEARCRECLYATDARAASIDISLEILIGLQRNS